jgi:hypothetical protein
MNSNSSKDYYELRGMIAAPEFPQDLRQRIADTEAKIKEVITADKEAAQIAITLFGLQMQSEMES